MEREGPESALPTPKNAATRRRLNMLAVPRQKAAKEGDLSFTATITDSLSSAETSEAPSTSQNTRSRYMYREANWEIGRAAERKGITVREFDKSDRWLAWRKRAAKAKKSAIARAAQGNRKGSSKKARKMAR